MIRHFFIALLILPVMAFSQQKRTIIISHEEVNRKNPFEQVLRHLTSPFDFIDRIFHKQRNLVNRLHDRVTINIDRHSGLTYRMPIIISDEHRIILNNKNVIILPQRKFFVDRDSSGIIIKRNGRTIYITRDRRS